MTAISLFSYRLQLLLNEAGARHTPPSTCLNMKDIREQTTAWAPVNSDLKSCDANLRIHHGLVLTGRRILLQWPKVTRGVMRLEVVFTSLAQAEGWQSRHIHHGCESNIAQFVIKPDKLRMDESGIRLIEIT